MIVTEHLETVGEWECDLLTDTPRRQLDQLHPFGTVHVTATDVPEGVLDGATVLDEAIYSGVLSPRSRGRTRIGGYGLAWHLGPISNVAEADSNPTASRTAAGHISTYIAGTNGIAAGSISASATERTIAIEAGQNRLQILTTICDTFGLEWRVNPDGTIDVDTRANLFVTAPTTIVTPRWGGRDRNITGYLATIRFSDDVDEYRGRWVTKPETGSNGEASISVPYLDFDGDPIVREGYTDASTTAPGATQATSMSAAQLGRFNAVRQVIEVDLADALLPRLEVAPGDAVYVWDSLQGLTGGSVVQYRGHLLDPLTMRVVTTRWSIRPGNGLFYRAPDGDGAAATVVRLTDYMTARAPSCELRLGAVPRALRPAAFAA